MDGVRQKLTEGVAQLGLTSDDIKIDLLLIYLNALIKWNKTYNLTAITDPAQMVVDHLLDALSVVTHLPASGRLIDIGTGGGVPGIILAVFLPDLSVTLLDSNSKKTAFLRQAVIELGLTNVEVVNCRVEAFQASGFDIIISRAFSSLISFVTLSAALISDTGRWFAMKGKLLGGEIDDFEAKGRYLIERKIALEVPGSQAERHLIIIKQRDDS